MSDKPHFKIKTNKFDVALFWYFIARNNSLNVYNMLGCSKINYCSINIDWEFQFRKYVVFEQPYSGAQIPYK